jgi:hypothetical protein
MRTLFKVNNEDGRVPPGKAGEGCCTGRLAVHLTLATALAAPVEAGMMLARESRPARQSFLEAPSTVF